MSRNHENTVTTMVTTEAEVAPISRVLIRRLLGASVANSATTTATVLTIFLAACGSGSSTATVSSVPPPPPPVVEAPPPPPTESAEEEQADSATEPSAATPSSAMAREYPASVRIGARVADVRTDPEEVTVQVGDSLTLGEDLEMVAFDANGNRIPGVPFRANIDSRFAVMQEGQIKGLAEGEAELRMAFRAPPLSGTGPPVIRFFSAPIFVIGPPVETIEIADPGVRILTGTVVQFAATAFAANGEVRQSASFEWRSNRRRLATVDDRGFVRAIRPGAVTITATAEGVEQSFAFQVEENPVASVELAGPSQARTGDVVRFAATARDAQGAEVDRAPVDFSLASFETRTDMGASIYSDGAFVAERPGLYRVTANAGLSTGQALIEVVDRDMEHEVIVTGVGLVADRPTSDLWAFTGNDGHDYVYTGTHSGGQRMLAWDVTNPANPVLTDFVEVDARVVNDVKVNSAGTVAVITREGASDRKNGIVVLDLTDPAHPKISDTYTENLTGGVHNVFFAGDILYVVHNGTFDVHILNLSRPDNVREVGRWGLERPGRYLHDIWVKDGLAYVSYWDDGVYILDVGDGRWGGTPINPVEVGSYSYPEGNTHVAFPYTNADGHSYLFVGDEIFGCDDCISRNGHPGDGSRGFIHILDMADPENLREVARYEVPEAGAHNLWIEDDRMYVAYYQAGLRVVDVSGELRGDLYRQGREIAWLSTGSPDGHVVNAPMAWGPQPFKGHVFLSDLNSGLWIVRVQPKKKDIPVS